MIVIYELLPNYVPRPPLPRKVGVMTPQFLWERRPCLNPCHQMHFLGSKYATIAFAARAPPRTALGSLRRSLRPIDRLKGLLLTGGEGWERKVRGEGRGGKGKGKGGQGRRKLRHHPFLKFLDPPHTRGVAYGHVTEY